MVVINDPRHTECSNLTDGRNIYVIIKTMCLPTIITTNTLLQLMHLGI